MSVTTCPTVTTYEVGMFSPDPLEVGTPQRVFGELVKIATPIVREYHSDLYWDAQTLRESIPGVTPDQPLTFLFIARHSGTHLNMDRQWSAALVSTYRQDRTARLFSGAVTVDTRGVWTLTLSELVK